MSSSSGVSLFFHSSVLSVRSRLTRTSRSRHSAAFLRTMGKMERENRMRCTSSLISSASALPPMFAVAQSARHWMGSCVEARSVLMAWITSAMDGSADVIITDTAM